MLLIAVVVATANVSFTGHPACTVPADAMRTQYTPTESDYRQTWPLRSRQAARHDQQSYTYKHKLGTADYPCLLSARHHTATVMAGSQDLQVVVDDPAPPVKPPPEPVKPAGWWSQPRNKALAAGALLLLVAVPAIVAPVVVTQQNKQRAAMANASSSSRSASLDGSGDGTDGVLADGTIKVPGRTFTGTNTTRNATTGLPEVTPEEVSPFVKIENGQFKKYCRPYYPTGFNAYELTMLVSKGNAAAVDKVFREASAKGMTTARTWAHSISELFPFQTAPGKYDPTGLKGLDYVLDSAARHNITLILSFIDNWKYYNGVGQYVDWSTTAPGRSMPFPVDPNGGDVDTAEWSDAQKKYETIRQALFYTDAGAAKIYKDHVKFIVNRKNSINGRIYKEDPTILAWNLINEPRCETWVPENGDCNSRLDKWFSDMADYVRSVDPNHLVTSGSEGFFGQSDPSLISKNPADWAAQTGQDFLNNNKNMDFAVTHAWPDNWQIPNDRQGQFLADWLQSHLSAAKRINKPLLFEEFGKKLENPTSTGDISKLRDPVFATTYDAVEKAIQSGEPLLGSMYWKWDTPTFPKGPYGVSAGDSTMDIINAHAQKVYDLQNSVPPRPGCIAGDTTKTLGAWFPAVDKASGAQGCVNNPEVALAYFTLYAGGPPATAEEIAGYGFSKTALAYSKALAQGQVKVWATKQDCCAAGFLGAFKEGCNA